MCDVADEAAVGALIAGVTAQEGRLDALVCNAGDQYPQADRAADAGGVVAGDRHQPDQHVPADARRRGDAARGQGRPW